MTWRQRAHEVVKECYLDYADITGVVPSPSMPDENKEEFLRILSRYYPFGQRKMHPYKIWLSVMKGQRNWLYRIPQGKRPASYGAQEELEF